MTGSAHLASFLLAAAFLAPGAALPPTAPTLPCSNTALQVFGASIYTSFCANTVAGYLRCWGLNSDEGGSALTPNLASGLANVENVVDISFGYKSACYIRSADRSVNCVGKNIYGDLDLSISTPNNPNSSTTIVLPAGLVPKSLASSSYTHCVVAINGSVVCFGDPHGTGQQQGDVYASGSSLQLVDLGTGLKAKQVVGLSYFDESVYQTFCALLDSNHVKCWGYCDNLLCYSNTTGGGYVGYYSSQNDMGDALPAVSLGTGLVPVALTAGDYHICALFSTNQAKCWGRPSSQLGWGGTGVPSWLEAGPVNVNATVFMSFMGDSLPFVDLSEPITQIAAGYAFTCVIVQGGNVKCFGENMNWQLGNTMRYPDQGSGEPAPYDMSQLPYVDLHGFTAKQLATGFYSVVALLDNNQVVGWGAWGELTDEYGYPWVLDLKIYLCSTAPTSRPSTAPTATGQTYSPTTSPVHKPSRSPNTPYPTRSPTPPSTYQPFATPAPSHPTTFNPTPPTTWWPTWSPVSSRPSASPIRFPSSAPTGPTLPTGSPSHLPTVSPYMHPSAAPTPPTTSPTTHPSVSPTTRPKGFSSAGSSPTVSSAIFGLAVGVMVLMWR